jgi:hypothetical protein
MFGCEASEFPLRLCSPSPRAVATAVPKRRRFLTQSGMGVRRSACSSPLDEPTPGYCPPGGRFASGCVQMDGEIPGVMLHLRTFADGARDHLGAMRRRTGGNRLSHSRQSTRPSKVQSLGVRFPTHLRASSTATVGRRSGQDAVSPTQSGEGAPRPAGCPCPRRINRDTPSGRAQPRSNSAVVVHERTLLRRCATAGLPMRDTSPRKRWA